MTILKILQFPDPKLHRVAKKVEAIDNRIQTIIDDMFATHYNTENCAALAATQLDIDDPPHITVIDYSPNKDQPLCLINPEIIERVGEQFEYEACMSIRPRVVHERVKRAEKIKVRALNRAGEIITLDAEGYFAKCIQHEVDHLNGIIYLDHLSQLKRMRIKDKIAKMK